MLTGAAAFFLATAAQAGGTIVPLSIRHQGRARTALLYVPASYQRPAPLIVVFHGGGGNAENAMRMTGLNERADRRGFLVLYPNGTGILRRRLLTWDTWNCCGYALEKRIDDVGFIRTLIKDVEGRYDVDRKRIFATGISNGGMMTHRVGCEMADVFAAIAPVAGALNADRCDAAAPVSVMIFHGTADQHVLFDGGVGSLQVGARGHPRTDHPVAYAAETWARIDRCGTRAAESRSGSIRKSVYGGGVNGTEVVVYAIEGQGHAWPGGTPGLRNGNADPPTTEISATDTMVDFFLSHPKP